MPRYFQRIRFHTSWRLSPPTGADTTREYSGLIRLHVSSFSCIFSLVVYVYLPKNTLFRSSRVLEVAPLLPESECKITTSFQYKPNLPATFLQSFLPEIRNALNDTQINFITKNMVLEDFFCSGVKKGLYCCLGYMEGNGRKGRGKGCFWPETAGLWDFHRKGSSTKSSSLQGGQVAGFLRSLPFSFVQFFAKSIHNRS